MEPLLTLRRSVAVVVIVSAAASAGYAVLGVGYVLDDWFTLRNARFDGSWAAAGQAQHLARPGAAAVYAVVFGLLGAHPLAVFALQAVIGAATAGVLLALLRRFLPPGLALGATVLWVVLPNHTSLEVWASATNIALALLLTLTGALVLTGEHQRRRLLAVVLFVLGALCYEAVIPLAGALIVVLPWLRTGHPDRRAIAGGVLGLGAVAVWIVVNWHPQKTVASETPDLSQVIPAHLGWGIAPAGPAAQVTLIAGLVGLAVVLYRCVRPATRGPAELAVLAGLAVIVLGVLPFVRYLYAPLGAGDRFSFISSIGGALVWAGILAVALAARREVAAGLAVILVAVALVARVDRARTWTDAGADALAIQRLAVATIPAPDAVIVVGPAPIQRDNIAAYLDQSNLAAALQIAYDDRELRAGLAFGTEQFESYPPEQRVDIGLVSRLRER